MNETDKDLIFSESVKAGKRIYYFDVKQSRNGDKYLAITESKKINEGTPENPHFVYEKHKLFLYKEDYEKFMDALVKTLDVAKGGVIPEPAPAAAPENSAPAVAPAPAPAAPVAPEPKPVADEVKQEKKSFLDKVKDIF